MGGSVGNMAMRDLCPVRELAPSMGTGLWHGSPLIGYPPPSTLHPPGVAVRLSELFKDKKRPLVIGHRGAMGHVPENTMTSFRRAVELGADFIEFDVHLCRDGHVVVIHDETLDRTTNGTGMVGAHTLAELMSLDAGGERIPTLEDVLSWAETSPAFLDVEIKSGPVVYPGIEEALVRAVRDHRLVERVIVISFDHQAVLRVKELEPGLATGLLYAGRPVDPIAMARAARADVLAPHWAYVRQSDVQLAHEHGIGVAPWVTSDPDLARSLFAAGIDALASNHPDVIRGVADALAS